MARSVEPSKVEHPAGLLRLVVLLETDFFQRLDHLLAAIVHAVRFADEGDHHVPVGRFVEDDFGVAGGNNLAMLFLGSPREHLVNLPLTKDLQVGVRFVQEQHGVRVRGHVRQQQEGCWRPRPEAEISRRRPDSVR